MKQAVYNKAGTRQIVDTGYKKFDKATNSISTGNIIANTQFGWFIRPYKKQFCNGKGFKFGELMQSDLKYFHNVSSHLMEIIKDPNREQSVILYEFFIGNDVIGHILCNAAHHLIASSTNHYGRCYEKRYRCIEELINYVSYDGTTEIPEVVKKNLIEKALSSNSHCPKVSHDNRKYMLHYTMLDTDYPEFLCKSRKYNPMYVSVYEVLDEISKYTGEPREVHIDNVVVEWKELV